MKKNGFTIIPILVIGCIIILGGLYFGVDYAKDETFRFIANQTDEEINDAVKEIISQSNEKFEERMGAFRPAAPVATSLGNKMLDDRTFSYGTDEDFRFVYDSTNARLEINDGTNDFLRIVDNGTTATFTFLEDIVVNDDATVSGDLTVIGTITGTGAVASNGIDFDEIADDMTLDANTTVTSATYYFDWGETELYGIATISRFDDKRQYITKEYVDTAIEGVEFDYFFNDTRAAFGTDNYYQMIDSDTGVGESSIATTSFSAGDDQFLAGFVTLSGEPVFVELTEGVYNTHVHPQKVSGVREVTLYWTFSKIDTSGNETVLITSEISRPITDKTAITIHGVLPTDTIIGATDRLLVKLFANVAAGGGTVDITLYQEGNLDSHLGVRTTTAIFSDLFVRRDGTVGLTGNWAASDGSYSITGLGNLGAEGASLSESINIAAGGYYKYNGENFAFADTSLDNFFSGGAGNLTATGDENTAFGFEALNDNTDGEDNAAFGYQALDVNTGGYGNAAFGYEALGSNIGGRYNTAIGESTLRANTEGNYNTAIGGSAGVVTTGGKNIFIGFQAGDSVTTGIGNIAIGYDVDVISTTTDNFLNIGNLIYGDLSTTSAKFLGINDSTPDTYTLSVDGTASISGAAYFGDNVVISTSGSKYLSIDAPGTTDSGIEFKTDSTSAWYIYIPGSSHSTEDLTFYDVTTDRVTFQQGGAVGIGDTTPDAMFDVAGSGIFDEELIVGTNLHIGSLVSTSYNLSVDGTASVSGLFNMGSITADGTVDFSGATLEIPNAANPTIDADGEIAVDTTANQLVYYGDVVQVLTSSKSYSWAIASAQVDILVNGARLPYDYTIASGSCRSGNVDGEIVTLDVYECSGKTGVCGEAITASVSCDNNATGFLPSDTAGDKGDFYRFKIYSAADACEDNDQTTVDLWGNPTKK